MITNVTGRTSHAFVCREVIMIEKFGPKMFEDLEKEYPEDFERFIGKCIGLVALKLHDTINVVNSLEERGVTYCEPAHDRIEEIRQAIIVFRSSVCINGTPFSEGTYLRGKYDGYSAVLSLFGDPKPR